MTKVEAFAIIIWMADNDIEVATSYTTHDLCAARNMATEIEDLLKAMDTEAL